MFLYRLGFPYHQLGHVQTGNVFVGSDNSCRLGGYDNTLLGYKTRLFRLCRQHEDHIDVVMFGNYVLVHNIIHCKKCCEMYLVSLLTVIISILCGTLIHIRIIAFSTTHDGILTW